MYKALIICFYVLGMQYVCAQDDTIYLQEAILLGKNPIEQSQTQSEIVLSDSILKRNQPSLTNVLNLNTSIYFKENGVGMVSSPSFRGTTASQTIVLWNGININSQTTGQTDFNTVNVRGFDQIKIKGGAGNVAETNNAVGGSIELINDLAYNQGFNAEINAKYGSFNTYSTTINTKYSSENTSLNFGLSRYASDNDYTFPNQTSRKNSNGQFYNQNLSLGLGHKLDSKNRLRFLGNLFQANRHLSVINPFETKKKYEDFNTRSLVHWNSKQKKFSTDFKIAYLTESYKYFESLKSDDYEPGKVQTFTSNFKLSYQARQNLRLIAFLEYIRNDGFSCTSMQDQRRHIGSMSISAQHWVNSKFYYELGIRQELSESYGNPILYSLGGRLKLTDFYAIRFNGSKNFRIPTYNDLYWPGAGNPNLIPETSYQVELTNEIKTKPVFFTFTLYHNWVENLIRWIPNSGVLGGIFWKPENIANVHIYGLEANLQAKKSIKNHHFSLNSTYGYTVSNDQNLDKQLVYVPYHKATATLTYAWKNLSFYYQFLFNGKVFTTTRNESEHQLPHYFLSNIGLNYRFGPTKQFTIGTELLNLTDYAYETVQARPAPGRNIHFFINLTL